MAAASGRPRLGSGSRPGPGRLGPEKAQRALPGVHHGPASRTGPSAPAAPGEPWKAARRPGVRARGAGPGDEPARTPRSAGEDRRREGGRREVDVRRQVARGGSTAPGSRLSPPPASPSSAGAERSRHVCPFLSRSRSRAPCVRAPAPQGRRDRFRP